MIIKINGEVITSTNNPISEFKEFISPVVDFFSWCKGVVQNISDSGGFWDWLEMKLQFLLGELIKGFLSLNDLLFLLPTIAFMIAYFLMGKNRTTKYILPGWFIYFITECLRQIYF